MTWLFAILGFAALIVLHEFGHFIAAKATGMRVERFFLFFPPKLVSVKRGETEYGIGAIPLGGFVKITGMNPDEELDPEVAPRAYYNQPVWKRIVTIGAGPAMNVLVAFVLLFILAFHQTQLTNTVDQIESGLPAAQVLQPGDRILAVDGKTGADLSQEDRLALFVRQIDKHKCPGEQTDGCVSKTPATVKIDRDGQTRTIEVTPVYDADVKRHRLGFSYGTEDVPETASGAVDFALSAMWTVTSKTVSTFSQLYKEEERKKLHGIVGISDVTHQAFGISLELALQILAVVSLSLALINLFPFLPLDGGHIFWAVVEKIRGRPVSYRTMERASMVGILLVLVIFAFGFSNDLHQLANGGFQLR